MKPEKIMARFIRVERLIEKKVQTFRRRYGLSRDEAWSAASLGFCQAVEKYDPREHASFPTWCMWKVEKRLMDLVRDSARDRLTFGHDLDQHRAKHFDVQSLFWRLDADGLEAVMMVLDPPLSVRRRARKKGNGIGALRRAVKRKLRKNGWSRRRINRAFRRVRRAL